MIGNILKLLMCFIFLYPNVSKGDCKPEIEVRREEGSNDYPKIIKQSLDHQLYIYGRSITNKDEARYWIRKIAKSGDVIWNKEFDAANDEEIVDFIETEKNDIIALGMRFTYKCPIGYKAWLQTIYVDKDIVDEKQIHGFKWPFQIWNSKKGNLLLVGAKKKGMSDDQIFNECFIGSNHEGDVLWEKTHNQTIDGTQYSGIEHLNKLFTITSSHEEKPGVAWLNEIDSTGNVIQEKEVKECYAFSSQALAHSGKELVSVFSSSKFLECNDPEQIPSKHAKVIGLDDRFGVIWELILEHNSIYDPVIAYCEDNEYIVVLNQYSRIKIIKIRTGGKIVWEKFYSELGTGRDYLSNQALGVLTDSEQVFVLCQKELISESKSERKVHLVTFKLSNGDLIKAQSY